MGKSHGKGEMEGRDDFVVLTSYVARSHAARTNNDDFASPCALQSRATAAVQVTVAPWFLNALEREGVSIWGGRVRVLGIYIFIFFRIYFCF